MAGESMSVTYRGGERNVVSLLRIARAGCEQANAIDLDHAPAAVQAHRLDQIGFGDQTNDQNVNGDFRIAGITLTPEPAMLSLIAFAGFTLMGRGRRS